jgi:hypothetical protein
MLAIVQRYYQMLGATIKNNYVCIKCRCPEEACIYRRWKLYTENIKTLL